MYGLTPLQIRLEPSIGSEGRVEIISGVLLFLTFPLVFDFRLVVSKKAFQAEISAIDLFKLKCNLDTDECVQETEYEYEQMDRNNRRMHCRAFNYSNGGLGEALF